MSNPLANYLANGEAVHGWLNQYSALFIANFSALQSKSGIKGAVGEIGVHMGRLFILLKLTATPGEKCFAIDVFSDQNKNLDRSGFGDRARFLENVRHWTGNTDIKIIETSSLDVKPDDLLAAVGSCRLISIDGGHTEECTFNDLQLSETVLDERGVIVLDDFFNQMWPGVATGASKYFLSSGTRLRPFAITPNKVYLSTINSHDFYRTMLQKTQAQHFNKTARMFGGNVDIFGCERNYRFLASPNAIGNR